MENIKTFENDSQYESNRLTRPAVSLIEDTYKVYYDEYVYTFNGLEIAKGNLYYDGTNFQISDSPFDNSYGEKYGKVAGSYYFNYSELGLYFDGRTQYFNDPTQNNEGITNKNTIDGWRIMSYDEWLGITTNRPDSLKATVNGVKASFAKVHISNGVASGDSLLLFPDAEVINGCSITLGWQSSFDNISDSELKEYLDQGCILLCNLGGYFSNGNQFVGISYWLSSEYTPGTATSYVTSPDRSYLYYDNFDKTSYAPVKLVRNLVHYRSGMDFNGHEYVDLGLPSGTLWATCNVGASNPYARGNLYAWGETKPKSEYTWANYKFNPSGDGRTFTKYNSTDGLTILELEDDAARVNWGGDWRMPTLEQTTELLNNTQSKHIKLNETWGRMFTGQNGNSMFLPYSGIWCYQYPEGKQDSWSNGQIEADTGSYWTINRLTSTSISDNAQVLAVMYDRTKSDIGRRAFGIAVRPVIKL